MTFVAHVASLAPAEAGVEALVNARLKPRTTVIWESETARGADRERG